MTRLGRLGPSRFYLGLVPPLLPTVSHQSLPDKSQHLLTRLAHSCHLYAIRLAACIWGIVFRHYHLVPDRQLL
jgi:hypothetical protein